jgi:hypothetical protein
VGDHAGILGAVVSFSIFRFFFFPFLFLPTSTSPLHHITDKNSYTPINHIISRLSSPLTILGVRVTHRTPVGHPKPIMSGPESFAIVAPLHQMRVSQIPLRPSEHTAVYIHTRNAFSATHNQDPKSGHIEMQSSLDHVRYNIVGKYNSSFTNHFPGLSPTNVHCKLRRTAMPDIYHQASSRFDGIWGTNAQDRRTTHCCL